MIQVRERVSRLDVGLPRGNTMPFGLTGVEIVATFVAVASLAIAVTYYWTTLRPEQAQLSQLERQFADQQRDINLNVGGSSSTASPSDIARDALESLEQFKSRHLKPLHSGEIELLNELNALAKKNHVQLASGIDTNSKIPGQVEEETSTEKKAPRIKKQEEILNAFPALTARFSVAGDYANLRAFVSELESSKQLIVIKAISMMTQEAKVTVRGARAQPASAGGLTLSIDMAAYFR